MLESGLALQPPGITHLVEEFIESICLTPTVISPKSLVFPVVAIVAKSIVFPVEGTVPSQKTALVSLLPVAPLEEDPDISPKSVAFPSVAIVINVIVLLAGDELAS